MFLPVALFSPSKRCSGIRCPGNFRQSATTDNPLLLQITSPFTSPDGFRSTSAFLPVGLTPRHRPRVPTKGSPSASLIIGRTIWATGRCSFTFPAQVRLVSGLYQANHGEQRRSGRRGSWLDTLNVPVVGTI